MGFINLSFSTFIVVSLLRIHSSTEDNPKRFLENRKCTNDSNCITHEYCHKTGICFCKDGYVRYHHQNISKEEPYHTVCLREAKFIGDYCNVDIQCEAPFGDHAVCIHADYKSHVGECQCLSSAHFKDGLCYKTALIGEVCDVNDNCLIKSNNKQAYCDHSQCICPPKHIPTIDRTDCQHNSELQGPCLDDAGCSITNSECRDGFCRCKKKFISVSNNYCLLLAEKLEDPCDKDDQCTTFLPNTRCDEERKVCICENNSHNDSTSCLRQENTNKISAAERLISQIFVCGGIFLLIMTSQILLYP